MKTICYAIPLCILLLPVFAPAQARPGTAEAMRIAREWEQKAWEFEDEIRGIDSDTLGFDEDGVLSGAPMPSAGPGWSGTMGSPGRVDRRERWLGALLKDAAELGRLSVEFRSFRFAPLEEPWARHDIREKSDNLEEAARDIFRSITGRDPETFDYDRAEFGARPLDERLAMIGGLAARTLSDILQTLHADVVDVAQQTTIASRLNILWELGRNLQAVQ